MADYDADRKATSVFDFGNRGDIAHDGYPREMRPADTAPEARRAQLNSFRAMRGEQRLAMAMEMSDEARRITLAGIAHRQPALGPSELAAELVRLLQR